MLSELASAGESKQRARVAGSRSPYREKSLHRIFALSKPASFAHNLVIDRTTPTRMDVPPDTSTDARLGRIVRLLSDNATVVVSGTRIAEELGTSRSEVWRAVQHLRELGLQITGHPATGYQLETVPDLLLPEILGPLVKGTMFASRMHHYFRVSSTNVSRDEGGGGRRA